VTERVAATKFTGERPGWGKDFDYDAARHLTAYLHARELARGHKVLDAGCGEGFGTQALAEAAREVVGIDYSRDAIAYCRERWKAPNLRFEVVDLTDPRGFDETFDLVLNFQVLEHIPNEADFLRSLRARMAPDATLMITTPNRLATVGENPYHLREYSAGELAALLGQVFADVRLLGMFGNEKVREFDRRRAQAIRRVLRLDPLGLRNALPKPLVRFAFARLAVLVRRNAKSGAPGASIAPEDFAMREGDLDEALDLVALCRA
jgi:2-polyprenyl-3-methyl-5-hydroxy-6-metoxy-1,4-benzoquinol methylase